MSTGQKKHRTSVSSIKKAYPQTYATQLARISKWHYGEKQSDGSINKLNYTEISELLQRDAPPSVSFHAELIRRLLDEAERLGVISFNINEAFCHRGTKDKVVTDNLRLAFDLHADSEVINLTDLPKQKDDDEDNFLHLVLANHTGDLLAPSIADGQHWALAGGRATIHVAKMISRKTASRRNIRITPLSGRVWAHDWTVGDRNIELPLDADDATHILSMAFDTQQGTSYSQIANPLYAKDSRAAQEIVESHCLFKPSGGWRTDRDPDSAVVGVGAVIEGSGHRLLDIVKKDDPRLEGIAPFLNSVREDIKSALALCERSKLSAGFGDVANRLFPVLPLPGDLTDNYRSHFSELSRKLEDLNRRTVVVNWDHLRSISRVVAVAGGTYKLHALWTLLLYGHFAKDKKIIKSLCTDKATAEKLINAMEDFSKVEEDSRKWYQEECRRIFDASPAWSEPTTGSKIVAKAKGQGAGKSSKKRK